MRLPSAAWGDVSTAMDLDREQRFAGFVAEHRDRALGLAYRLVGGDLAAAEDVTQEAFVRAYRGLDRFRGSARLSTWFYRILVNEANRHHRFAWVRRRSPDEPPEPDASDAPAPGDPMLRARVSGAVARLPRGQREAFVLVHLEGFSVAEAAEITGRAVGTLKSHLHRALRSLRAQLADLDPRQETST
ncbi:MAG: RNA polymerase sigma factor [Myxococcota bacterium]